MSDFAAELVFAKRMTVFVRPTSAEQNVSVGPCGSVAIKKRKAVHFQNRLSYASVLLLAGKGFRFQIK